MKIKAFILLLCFSSYFYDRLAAINFLITTCEEQSSCCSKMVDSTPGNQPQKCPTEEEDCSNICINCPLSIFTGIAPAFNMQDHGIPVINSFRVYKAKLVHDFYAKAWKPPKMPSSFV